MAPLGDLNAICLVSSLFADRWARELPRNVATWIAWSAFVRRAAPPSAVQAHQQGHCGVLLPTWTVLLSTLRGSAETCSPRQSDRPAAHVQQGSAAGIPTRARQR